MIYLKANNENIDGEAIVCLFLKDNCSLSEPYFTWKIKNKQSKKEIIFACPDLSPNPLIYSKFLIKIKDTNPILTMGEIMAYPGEYNFEIYESPDAGELLIENCVNIVKEGILIIEGEKKEKLVYQNLPKTRKVYNGK